MSNDLPSVLLSGAPAIAGFAILRFASQNPSSDRLEIGFWRAASFVLAGLLLIALPLAIWIKPILGHSFTSGTPASPGLILLLAGYLDAALLWLIWNINTFAFRNPLPCATPWDENWGATYSPELKRRLLSPLLTELDDDGKIGRLVVDVGSGAKPVSCFLPPCPGRRFIHLDIAALNLVDAESCYVRFNAEYVNRPDSIAYRKALLQVSRFLVINPHRSAQRELATTLLFSDILNYVDFRNVLLGFLRFLAPGGRIIIVNLPTRGIESEFSEKRLKRNEDLYAFLAEQHLEIESKEFPCRPAGATDESEEMIVLVARKA